MTDVLILDSLHDSPTRLQEERLASLEGCCLSIGNFDGVHLGHQTLLRELTELAGQHESPAAAVLFDPHPASILRPDSEPPRLTEIDDRAALMNPLGIDHLVVCRTSRSLLEMSAEDFFRSLVVQRLRATGMVEGPNFYFGKDRGGDVGRLRELCLRHDIELRIAEPRSCEGSMISSSRIRDALIAGDVALAATYLGRPYAATGHVAEGAGRGRTIGFPTANVEGIGVMLPAEGVYSGLATIGDNQKHPAAIHLGKNPTFESDGLSKVEVHLLDYDGVLYGTDLKMEWIDRVRGVQTFANAEDLRRQIATDLDVVRRHFRGTQ